MIFKNLTVFLLPKSWLQRVGDLEALLAEHRATPLIDGALYARGFVSPFGEGNPVLTLAVPGYTLMTQEIEQRRVSASAVAKALKKKIDAIEAATGKKIGGRQRKQLKFETVEEIARRTPSVSHRVSAYLDHARGWLAIDASSTSAAEDWLSALRHALGSAPATPPNAAHSVRNLLTSWAAGAALPQDMHLGWDIELRDPSVKKNKVVGTEVEIAGEEIQNHITAGRQVTRLALSLGDRLDFQLTDTLQLRKLKSLDGLLDSRDAGDTESAEDQLSTDLILEGDVLGDVVTALFAACGVAAIEDAPQELAKAA